MAKILLVDDERSIRITLSAFLEKENHEVVAVSNVVEALAVIAKGTFDLIVSDVIMSGKSGLDLLRDVRDLGLDIPVVIMTGEPTVETAVLGIQHQASDYLSKPVERKEFLRVIKRVLDIKQLLDDKKQLEIENAQYQKNLESLVAHRTEALLEANAGVVNLLAKVIEYRDPYTAGHQRRVGNLAAEIAQIMGYSAKQIEDVRIIGYVHDVGKIVVPSEILSKPGKISPLEMLLIREHAQAGYDLLLEAGLSKDYALAVGQHHERYNGSGYPNALSSSETLLEAQILVVADVVEAMISHRPYRPAKKIEEAMQEIEQNKGTLYHPDVVDACVSLLNQKNYAVDDSTHKIQITREEYN